jgi:ASC-1-like (ASCH) protein
MKTWTLKIRAVDKRVFDQIVSGTKTIETRAATKDFNVGDRVIFKCGKDISEKTIASVRKYVDFEEYLKKEDLTKVFGPGITADEARRIHYSFPGYKEKLEKYGIVAFELK